MGNGDDDDASSPTREPWVLELQETSHGQVVCSAYMVGSALRANTQRQAGSWGDTLTLLHFDSFALELHSSKSGLSTELHSCRAPGRVRVEAYGVSTHKDKQKVVLESNSLFKGEIEFVTVQADVM